MGPAIRQARKGLLALVRRRSAAHFGDMAAMVTLLVRPAPGRTRPAVGRLGHLLVVVAMVLLGVSAAAMPASAHGTDESKEGYVLIQQALGHLAHDGGHVGMDAAMEKVDDALAAMDHDGVDVAEVEQAK